MFFSSQLPLVKQALKFKATQDTYSKIDNLCRNTSTIVMHVSLTPELEYAVKMKVSSGLYNNASEVIREALRMTIKAEAENEWLKREAAIGYLQLDIAETVRVSNKAEFEALARSQA